jgi:predicted DNA repair protein MutK
MPSGLAALLDDIAVIAKAAAASVDDVAAASAKASAKAAGVVIDDTAVTPRYLVGFTPDRELPIIWRIAKGSLRNKLLFIVPVALLLQAVAPWAVAPLLMIGGAYLCFEGAEKLIEVLSAKEETLEQEVADLTDKDHEAEMVSGAIRTDFILSAEIIAIALNSVADKSFGVQVSSLLTVAILITVGVYGLVALIVKMDDIGLDLAKRKGAATQKLGLALVAGMPYLLSFLSALGTAAMIWVGGDIIVHSLETYGIDGYAHLVHDLSDGAQAAVPFGGAVLGWLVGAIGAGLFGLAVGAVIVFIHHRFARKPH